MTPQLTNIKNTAGIQAVLNPGFGQGPSIVTRNYQQLAVGLPLYQSHGVASKGFIDLAGADAAEGVRLPGTALLIGDLLADDDPQKPVVDGLRRRVPGRLRRGALDLRRLRPRRLRHPRRRASPAPAPPSPQAIRDAIEATSGLAGTTGVVTMTPGGPPRLRPLGLPHARDQGRRLDPRPVTRPGARADDPAACPAPLSLGARRRWPNSCNSSCPGVTVGAVYALVALGFTIIYNASDVVNFAQGEFVMLGGMITVFANMAGLPLPLAALIAIAGTAARRRRPQQARHRARPRRAGRLAHHHHHRRLDLHPRRRPARLRQAAPPLPGLLRRHPDPASSAPPSCRSRLWVLAGAIAVFIGLWLFFTRTLTGRAVLATSNNRLAAQLVGINTNWVMTLSFALSAAIGALAGVLVTPDHQHQLRRRHRLALKGFAAAMLGGMGNPMGALVGGILLGLIEALTAGYLSLGLQGRRRLRRHPRRALRDAAGHLRPQVDGPGVTMTTKRVTLLVLAIIVIASPFFFPSNYYYRVGSLIFVNGLAVTGMVILIGYAGQISLGHAGFAGIGGYACALAPGPPRAPPRPRRHPRRRHLRRRSPGWSAARSSASRATTSPSRPSASASSSRWCSPTRPG